MYISATYATKTQKTQIKELIYDYDGYITQLSMIPFFPTLVQGDCRKEHGETLYVLKPKLLALKKTRF